MRIKFTKKKRIAAFALSVLAAAGFTVGGVISTGAFFSDSHNGTISGTVGSIKIVGSGGTGPEGLNLSYDGLLPGAPQTQTIHYQNTGTSPEDVWVVFNNADALHALNDLGTYGEFHIAANGDQVFDSTNLNDNAANSCGPLSPAGCWPVPRANKVASNVAPGASGSIDLTFGYAGKLKTQSPAGGGVWNAYPVSAPTASGLPYQLVATQHGQTP